MFHIHFQTSRNNHQKIQTAVAKKLSIKDIAQQLKISPTAVSFVLNGKAKEMRVSEEVVKKVEKFILQTGYKPNSLARSLRTGKTNILALMIEDISNPFFANIARMIEDKAYKNGYKIIYSSNDNDSEKAKDLITMYRERHVDGYIITPSEGMEEEVNALIKEGMPVVVVIDNEESTYQAVKHLIKQGFKEIAFITLNSLQWQMQERLNGYERAIQEAGLTSNLKELTFVASTEGSEIERHISAYLKRKPNLDAVLFGTNYIGVSGLKAIRSMGLQIPNDIAVASFDDHDVFQLNSPSITAIEQPLGKIAEQLITMLLERITIPYTESPAREVVLPAKLLIRNSTVKISKKVQSKSR
jgi:LacI family transcriptional regulator